METLQITKEAAIEAYENAKGSGRKLLEDLFGKKLFVKNIRERIDGFEDVLRENGITSEEFNSKCAHLTDDEIAYKQLKEIFKAYNQGEVVDYTDKKQYKTIPYFTTSSPSGAEFSYNSYGHWRMNSLVGSRLAFVGPDRIENCKHAACKFLDIFRRFHMLSGDEI